MSLTYTIVDGEVVFRDCDRRREEIEYYANILDSAIKGKHVTIVCHDLNEVRMAMRELERLSEAMLLEYTAYYSIGNERMLIGDYGVIDFDVPSSPMRQSRNRCRPLAAYYSPSRGWHYDY